ncbi:rRNA maturation RNase YbeY [Subsaximicrobium wynnwilliamsii]|uniref:Endoribonuclease YbeY n=1 Tax=Subsaximicrobium wynnwilliamsii TaxID=291179 RepID=A0A5C6ZKN5_9FLAO|nr:rRNA maturation RNase YbeY [Subsaximicrobium wynnwilliamsii]TXD83985.1 rRNA maturation RNase YbeY [Subsaximicrobium wynnwilliamsii]TXD89725.1 rRNA maturation RNase YbeY [Subsaximicrobium wynnwilliamsii]TXE01710.1 rRNA maturation RNase YbeY [Subsaximicrobium wynnwilliamsii]
MINFNYETEFKLTNETNLAAWLTSVIASEEHKEGEINYVFCDDDYLHKLNLEFLEHDTLTDIISFDYSIGKELHGDIYISVERVRENASEYSTDFEEELQRVMVHGILHYCGYKDKTESEQNAMRAKEDLYLIRL